MRYPVFLDLADRLVVVVGGGSVAKRRTSDLLAAGAQVHVVAPSIDSAIPLTAVTAVRRPFQPTDLDGAWLAFACTDDSAVNDAVSAAAQSRGVWCIRADDAERSRAWRPASAQVDEITIAVSAGGDPRQAARLRDRIETLARSGELTARRGRRGGGRVILVGGGPGDPDLLTLRGYRALLDADVVVTDRLGPTGLLELLPEGVEIIDVGKTPGGHAAEQSAINELIVLRALQGDLVVRLKGGDPFVFGRGSEEVDACVAAGVVVDVVPGLTSAVSAGTLAGVPLTERGVTQQFTVVSGHVPPGDPRSSVDWGLVGAGDATIVLLMAVANLRAITAALIDSGRKPGTAALVIENASLPQQRLVRATLAELPDAAESSNVVPPAVVIIGDVVRH